MSLALKLAFFELVHVSVNGQVLPWLVWLVQFTHETRTSTFY